MAASLVTLVPSLILARGVGNHIINIQWTPDAKLDERQRALRDRLASVVFWLITMLAYSGTVQAGGPMLASLVCLTWLTVLVVFSFPGTIVIAGESDYD